MIDFTIDSYTSFLSTLKIGGYDLLTFKDFFFRNGKTKHAVLRHDVDKLPENSLLFALTQNRSEIAGTYYFRANPPSFNKNIIQKIASLGHEIGYHYETMDTCHGNVDRAYDEFCRNLEMFRKIVPIETACMHGSPLSKYDNRLIWEKYDYNKLGILAEPSMDVDFNHVFYITDTGRMWDGDKVSIRDKPRHRLTTIWPSYHSTYNIINALNEGTFPNIAMITIHPQRWTNNRFLWFKEYIIQNLKNQVKKHLVK